MPDDLVLTPLEVARLLRVSDVTVRRMITRGILPRIAGVRIVLIPRSAVDCLLLGEYDVASDGSRQGPGNDRPEQDAERRGSVADRRDDSTDAMATMYSGASEVQDRLAVERLGEALG